MMDYIETSIGKVIITYEDDDNHFLKEENGTYKELTQTELDYANSLFKTDYGYIYDSAKLNLFIDGNEDIERENYCIPLLNWLESIIPYKSLDNFYQNLNNVKIIMVNEFDNDNYNNFGIGEYDSLNNKILLNQKNLLLIKERANKTGDPILFYNNHLYRILLHELAHMSSAEHIGSNIYCGYDQFPKCKNRGLTEGMTEYIAFAGTSSTIPTTSNYYIEVLLTSQLVNIVGIDTMFESYFCDHNIDKIRLKLNKIINNRLLTYYLFKIIQNNFAIKNKDIKQTFLGKIQNILIDYFIEKSNHNLDEINEFEGYLITPNILKQIGRDPNNYIGLKDALDKFAEFKESQLKRR